MSILERPRLRPGLATAPDSDDPRYVFLWDQFHLSRAHPRLTRREFEWVRQLDGERTLAEIHAALLRDGSGPPPAVEALAALVRRLEEALFLDGPRYRECL